MSTVHKFEDGTGEAGICPVCGSDALEYPASEGDNVEGIYPWRCEDCGAEGEEQYTVTFNGHYNKN